MFVGTVTIVFTDDFSLDSNQFRELLGIGYSAKHFILFAKLHSKIKSMSLKRLISLPSAIKLVRFC